MGIERIKGIEEKRDNPIRKRFDRIDEVMGALTVKIEELQNCFSMVLEPQPQSKLPICANSSIEITVCELEDRLIKIEGLIKRRIDQVNDIINSCAL